MRGGCGACFGARRSGPPAKSRPGNPVRTQRRTLAVAEVSVQCNAPELVDGEAQWDDPAQWNPPDAGIDDVAVVMIQKCMRGKLARTAVSTLREKMSRRMARAARRASRLKAAEDALTGEGVHHVTTNMAKVREPWEFGADYCVLGEGRNVKWAFDDRGAVVSSKKPKADPLLSIGDRLVAINDRRALGCGKSEVKTLWKDERGASEATVLYFIRAQAASQAEADRLPDVAEAPEEEVEKDDTSKQGGSDVEVGLAPVGLGEEETTTDD